MKEDAKGAEEKKEGDEPAEKESSTSDEEVELTKADLKRIKKLIQEQDDEIEELKKANKKAKKELQYQYAENDNTVKRYKNELKLAQEFAVSKFAKDMLEIRDNLQRAIDYCKIDDLREIEDPKELISQLESLHTGIIRCFTRSRRQDD